MVPVALGAGSCRNTYYCGRNLGISLIPGSDGRCGFNDGPQCPDCKVFVASETQTAAQLDPHSNKNKVTSFDNF